eukprot:scaffold6549_cov286-Chaetoceros_neogracile.AAC.2
MKGGTDSWAKYSIRVRSLEAVLRINFTIISTLPPCQLTSIDRNSVKIQKNPSPLDMSEHYSFLNYLSGIISIGSHSQFNNTAS